MLISDRSELQNAILMVYDPSKRNYFEMSYADACDRADSASADFYLDKQEDRDGTPVYFVRIELC